MKLNTSVVNTFANAPAHRIGAWIEKVEQSHRLHLLVLLSAGMHALLIIALGGERTPIHSNARIQSENIVLTKNLSVTLTTARTENNLIVPDEIQPRPLDDQPPSPPSNDPAKETIAGKEANAGARQLAATPLADNHYYRSSELDIKPVVRELINAEPDELRAHTGSGVIVISVWINEVGRVDSVIVDSSTMPEDLTEAIRLQLSNATFAPAEKDGRRVRSYTKYEFSYMPLSRILPQQPIKVTR